jgi:type IV pilus assembly protein PilV
MKTLIQQRSAGRGSSGGFTIVEVLVALVVVAVGMLGIAGLYITTLRSGGGAIYRMQAVNLASDMADRIRANRTAGLAYANAAANNGCAGAGAVDCTPAQMAGNDLDIWTTQLAATLPSGTGAVAVNNVTTPFTYTITINWNEPGQNDPLVYVMTIQI